MKNFPGDSVQALYSCLQTAIAEPYSADRPVFLLELDDILNLPILGVFFDLEAA